MHAEGYTPHVGPDALVRADALCSCRAQSGRVGEGTRRYACLLGLVLFLALTSLASAQSMTGGILGPSASVKPPGLTNVGIEQRLNEQSRSLLALRFAMRPAKPSVSRIISARNQSF